MIQTKAFAAHSAATPLSPFDLERRDPLREEVLIEILYCGVCHSDIHTARNEWGSTRYPVVPGHEIVGKVILAGEDVKAHLIGDIVGVGCLVGSCNTCSSCRDGLEQYCENGSVPTYNALLKDGSVTYGGYSDHIVVHQDFVLKIRSDQPLEKVAPLLCAGITTYSPLKHWGVGKGHKVGIVGLGGLGHMGVKIASSFGAEVTVMSTSPSKESDAKRLGAQHFLLTTNSESLISSRNRFDFILDTVSAPHNYNDYLNLLTRDGIMICVGAPPSAAQILPFNLIGKRKSIAGSLIGGIRETQEMLDYCAAHEITSDVEVIAISEINKAYERMLIGDVKYRFVIDMKTI